MDPLTHTLVGASLSATQLGEKTRLAAPALLIGANLPDVDVLAYTRGADFALGFRRGWTHGVLALVVLPAILAIALWAWDRWRSHKGPDPPLATGWLFGLSYLAVATHPTLDWLNTYGMRWLMPLRDTWYYGDSVFIVDPWLWLILGGGWLMGRRATRTVVVLSAVIVAWLTLMVLRRAPDFLPLVVVAFLVLLAALLRKPKATFLASHRVATTGLILATLYIGSMIALQGATKKRVGQELADMGIAPIQELMVGPTPANPLAWDVVAGTDGIFRFGRFSWHQATSLQLSDSELPAARASTLWQELEASGQAPGFLRWVRYPWLELDGDQTARGIYIMDARYARRRKTGFGAFRFELPAAEVK